MDQIIFRPRDVDLSRSPLRGQVDEETFVLGAFNPGLTRLPNGNLLLMVRVAEALKRHVRDDHVAILRWASGRFRLDRHAKDNIDTQDPRELRIKGGLHRTIVLTSISWLLPVELSSDGSRIVAQHYDRAIAPRAPYQEYGVEDPRISRVDGRYLMTSCSVSAERLCTSLYTSDNALDWKLEGVVLDHQNKDMLIFEGLIKGEYWAQTRPLGDLYFAYPPGSEWRAGPSINLATSPDALHWRPHINPGIRPHSGTAVTARIGGGAPPILTEIGGRKGWLSLWHGVEPKEIVGIYRTYWSLLDPADPSVIIASSHTPLLSPEAELTKPLEDIIYIRDVVFTTGIAEAGDRFIVASGEADLACRITHVPAHVFHQV